MTTQACSAFAVQRSSLRLSCVSHAYRVAVPVSTSSAAVDRSARRMLAASAPSAPAKAPRVVASSVRSDCTSGAGLPGISWPSPTSAPYGAPLGICTGTTIWTQIRQSVIGRQVFEQDAVGDDGELRVDGRRSRSVRSR